MRPVGRVWLVGAGPGAADLLTVRAHTLVTGAEVVAFDELVSEKVLALVPAHAERIRVGRRANGSRFHEGKIHPLVVQRALEGKAVVRLKGGDPYVFGRGGEEAEELAAAGVPVEVVPGISAALAAAASAHIPLTHRECASSVSLVTAHAAHAEGLVAPNIPPRGTLVFYMGLARMAETCAALVASSRAAHTPVAVVARATLPDERVVIGTLDDIAAKVAALALEGPAVVIVGEVVSRRV
ncbi:MAG: uroporphyrinogen-III C-methyltransferase [Polyangiaceae bacterium]